MRLPPFARHRTTFFAFASALFAGFLSPLRAQPAHQLVYAPAPIDNPLKGFVPYDSKPQAEFPHSLEWFYISLASLMPAPNQFDWAPMEKHLAAIAGRGHQAVMRVFLDYPNREPGTPKFLLDAGIKTWPNNYKNSKGPAISPDYEDPRVREALKSFVAAFGKKYDGDPRLGFITVGLLGYWGEWHTSDHKERFASKPVQTEVMDAYAKAFHRTRLLLRYPAGPDDPYYADNHDRAMGYHDDSFAYATMPNEKPESWFFLDRMTRAKALDKWRTQPIGGEVRPEVWDTMWNDPPGTPQGQDYATCLDATHATWLMNTGVFRPALTGAARDRALAGARGLGYELYVSEAGVTVTPDEDLQVKISVRNTGVAPFYYPWTVEIGLVTDTGKLAASAPTDWDFTHVLPDADDQKFSLTLPLPSSSGGIYQVVMRMVNPMPSGAPVRFANQTQDQTRPGWVSLGLISR